MPWTPDERRPGFLRQEPDRPRARWLAHQYDHHVVARCLRRFGDDHPVTVSAVNLGAWLDRWADR